MDDNYNIVATQNIEEDEVMQDSSEGGVDGADDENWPTIVAATCVMTTYFYSYICKEPCMTSYQTELKWVLEMIRGHEKRCMNMFRVNKETFLQLCDDLEKHHGLHESRRMSTIEKVGMFLYTFSVGASNRDVVERFQHSGETVSRCFREVLSAVLLLAKEVIKPTDPEFKKTPSKIQNDARYMPHFKVINFSLSLFSINDFINYYFLIFYYNDDRIVLE